MNIIAISGHAQHGKDTFALMLRSILEEHGETVLIAHYGDLVKYICRKFFRWNGEKDDYGRHLLQYVGTDIVRQQCPDFWVDFIVQMLKLFGDNWSYVLIPDTRFPNEIDGLLEAGFRTRHLRIVRPDFVSPLTEEQQQHPSETALDSVTPDDLILNDGSLEHLELLAEQYVKEKIYGTD